MSEITNDQITQPMPKRAHFFKDISESGGVLEKGKVRTAKGERATSRLSKETKASLKAHFQETVLAKDPEGNDPDFLTIQTRGQQELARLREQRNGEGLSADTKRTLHLAELSLQKHLEAALRNRMEAHLEASNSPWVGITQMIREKVYANALLEQKVVDNLVRQYVLSSQELIGRQLIALAQKDAKKTFGKALSDDSNATTVQAAYDAFITGRMQDYLDTASEQDLIRLRENGLNELTFHAVKNDNHRYSPDYFVNKNKGERTVVLQEDILRQLEHTALDIQMEKRAKTFEEERASLQKTIEQQQKKPNKLKRFFPSRATVLRTAGAFAGIFSGASTIPMPLAFSEGYTPEPITIQVDRPVLSSAVEGFVEAVPSVVSDFIEEPIAIQSSDTSLSLPTEQIADASGVAIQSVDKNISQILAQQSKEKSAESSQEAKPLETKVQGIFITTDTPQLFLPESDIPVKLDTLNSQFQVKEMKETSSGNFRYIISLDGKDYEVPVSEINLKEGTLTKEVGENKNFGVRVHDREGVQFAKSLGATAVRIAPVDGRIGEDGNLIEQNPRDAIEEAEKQGLNILYVFNPDFGMTKEQIDEELTFLAKHKSIKVEIGNEPNLPQFWDGTIEDFAHFVKDSSEKLWKIDPDKKIVVGAFFDPTGISGPASTEKLYEFSDALDTIGFNKKDPRVSYAIHEYNFGSYITDAIKLTKELFGDNIEITETGVDANAPDSSKLFGDLLQTLESANIPFSIHELRFDPSRKIDPFTRERLSIVDKGDFRVEMMRANNAKEENSIVAKSFAPNQR